MEEEYASDTSTEVQHVLDSDEEEGEMDERLRAQRQHIREVYEAQVKEAQNTPLPQRLDEHDMSTKRYDPKRAENDDEIIVLNPQEGSDLRKVIILAGYGDKDRGRPIAGSQLHFMYRGFLSATFPKEEFDEAGYEIPFEFTLHEDEDLIQKNAHKVPPIFHRVGATMVTGQKVKLYVPFRYGYGETGNTKLKIPPNTDLIYEIELTRWFLPPKQRLERLTSIKEKGNNAFKASLGKTMTKKDQSDALEQAVHEYYKAYMELEDLDYYKMPYPPTNKEHHHEQAVALLVTLCGNLAAAYLKMNDTDRAISYCDHALSVAPNNIKSLHRRCKAYESQEDYREALKDVNTLCALQPEHKLFVSLRNQISAKLKKLKTREQSRFGGMFGGNKKTEKYTYRQTHTRLPIDVVIRIGRYIQKPQHMLPLAMACNDYYHVLWCNQTRWRQFSLNNSRMALSWEEPSDYLAHYQRTERLQKVLNKLSIKVRMKFGTPPTCFLQENRTLWNTIGYSVVHGFDGEPSTTWGHPHFSHAESIFKALSHLTASPSPALSLDEAAFLLGITISASPVSSIELAFSHFQDALSIVLNDVATKVDKDTCSTILNRVLEVQTLEEGMLFLRDVLNYHLGEAIPFLFSSCFDRHNIKVHPERDLGYTRDVGILAFLLRHYNFLSHDYIFLNFTPPAHSHVSSIEM